MTLNADLVRQRIQEVAESLGRLERFQTTSKAEFLTDQDARDIVCYRLLLAIEAALSLCYHWSARRLHTTPEDYAACFARMADAGVIPTALADRLQQMARFRNLLVHMYWRIDYERVYEILQYNVTDLREFAAVMAGQIASSEA